MELFRIVQEQFAADLSGNGSRLFGGRWNSEGLFALYTSSTRALALLETLAHTPAKMLAVRPYLLITIRVPDAVQAKEIEKEALPPGWDSPDTRPVTRIMGDKFLREKKNVLLAVPSVLVPEENNFVLNPVHPDMKKIKIVARRRILFDKRAALNL